MKGSENMTDATPLNFPSTAATATTTTEASDERRPSGDAKRDTAAAAAAEGRILQEETKTKSTASVSCETDECLDPSESKLRQEEVQQRRHVQSNESVSETQLLTKKIRTSNQGKKVVDREKNGIVNHDSTIKDLTTYKSSVVQFPKEVSSLHAHSSIPHSYSSSKTTTTPNKSHLPTEDNGDYTTMDRNITFQLNDNQDDASNTHQDPPLPFPNHNHNLQGNGQGGRLVLPGAVSYSFRNGRREHRRPPLQWLPGGIMRKQQLTDGGPQPSTVYDVSDEFRSSSYRNRSSDDFSITERDAAVDPNNDSDDDNTEE